MQKKTFIAWVCLIPSLLFSLSAQADCRAEFNRSRAADSCSIRHAIANSSSCSFAGVSCRTIGGAWRASSYDAPFNMVSRLNNCNGRLSTNSC